MCVRASFSGAVAINPLQLYYIILYLFKGQAHEPFYQTKQKKKKPHKLTFFIPISFLQASGVQRLNSKDHRVEPTQV